MISAETTAALPRCGFMAGSHTFSDMSFAPRANVRDMRVTTDRERGRTSMRLAIAAGACLALTPIAVMAVLPSSPERKIELGGSVLGFAQDGNTINVTLAAADAGQRLFVEGATGQLLELPVSPGQTVVSTELPEDLATSGSLTIRVI